MAFILTIVFYIINVINSFTRLRKAFIKGVTERYCEKHPNYKKKRSSMAMLSRTVHDELDRVGLSVKMIAIYVSIAMLVVTCLLGLLFLAQNLFFASRGTGFGDLIGTLIPCIVVLVGSIEDNVKIIDKA